MNELTYFSRFECKACTNGLRLQMFNSNSYRANVKYLKENSLGEFPTTPSRTKKINCV